MPPLTMHLQPLCVGANISHIFEIPDSDLSIHFATYLALLSTYKELPAKVVLCPVFKTIQHCTCFKSHGL